MKKLLMVIIMFLFSLFSFSQQIKLVFRYDDFFLRKDSLNEFIVNTFQKYNLPLVLGVIPCDKNEQLILDNNYNYLSVLKKGIQNESIEIALHGLTHAKIADGEFGNVATKEQYRRMYKGKKIIDSIFNQQTGTFIPPWNAYDVNTLNVMEQLGFKVISSSLTINQSFANSTMTYLPHTIDNLKKLSSVLDKNKNRKATIVVMFHAYDFNKDFNLQDLDNLLSSLTNRTYLKFATFDGLQQTKETFDHTRMEINLDDNLLSKYLKTKGAVQTTSFALLIRLTNILIYVIIFILTYLLSYLLFFKTKKSRKNMLLYSIPVILIISLSVYFHLFSPIKSFIIVIISSLLLPFALKNKNIHSRE